MGKTRWVSGNFGKMTKKSGNDEKVGKWRKSREMTKKSGNDEKSRLMTKKSEKWRIIPIEIDYNQL